MNAREVTAVCAEVRDRGKILRISVWRKCVGIMSVMVGHGISLKHSNKSLKILDCTALPS